MKLKFTVFMLLFVFIGSAFPQNFADNVKQDTLRKYLREISGDTQISLDGNTYTITSRATSNKNANYLAAKYLKFRLQTYGLNVTEQVFYFNSGVTEAKNILAVQTGSTYPEKKFIICGHFDDVTVAPGANDNGTGTCAVLEAARVISKLNPKYTIVYALWSGEEQGLYGSDYYAGLAYAAGEQIMGVINMDMIGWDGNLPNELAVYNVLSNTMSLVDNLSSVNITYNINLSISKKYTIETRSDHHSFYKKGYPAYLLIENDWGSDPYYHKSSDAFSTINMSFYTNCAKLAICSLAELSGAITSPLAVDDINTMPKEIALNQNYPNPFNPATVISYSLKSGGNVNLTVFDALGREIKTLVNEYKPAGSHQVSFAAESKNFTSGIYFYKLQSAGTVLIKKMVYLK